MTMGSASGVSGPDVFVFRIGQFGDTVVALPAIHRIAQLHPTSRLVLITNAPSRGSFVTAWEVLKHTGLFAEAVSYDARNPRELFELAKRCRASRGAILYYLSPRRSVLQLARDTVYFKGVCGFAEVVGLSRALQPSMRDLRGQLRHLPREWERLLKVVDPTSPTPVAPFLKIDSPTSAKAWELLAPLAGRRVVALGPGSKMPAKKWFPERFAEVAERILREYPDVGVAVFGGGEDRAQGDALVAALPRGAAVNCAGRTNIIESAAALAQCVAYVGNDTGTMHLAAIMGVPCIAIFTSRDNRDVWVPWGEAHEILRRDLPCSGCMLTECEAHEMRCLDLITVDDVLSAVRRRL